MGLTPLPDLSGRSLKGGRDALRALKQQALAGVDTSLFLADSDYQRVSSGVFLRPGIAGGRRYSKSNKWAFSINRTRDTLTPLTHTTYPRSHTHDSSLRQLGDMKMTSGHQTIYDFNNHISTYENHARRQEFTRLFRLQTGHSRWLTPTERTKRRRTAQTPGRRTDIANFSSREALRSFAP